MADKKVLDQFANVATISLVESAANTLTYKKLETGIAMFDKVAWVISRLEVFIPKVAANLNGDTDCINFALMVSNSLSTIAGGQTQFDQSVLYGGRVMRTDWGAAATMVFDLLPHIYDFSTLPGGGLIAPPSPLYGAIQGVGCVAPNTVFFKLFYTNLSLTPDQYWELVEARRYISS
jgi:hypothetical protein